MSILAGFLAFYDSKINILGFLVVGWTNKHFENITQDWRIIIDIFRFVID